MVLFLMMFLPIFIMSTFSVGPGRRQVQADEGMSFWSNYGKSSSSGLCDKNDPNAKCPKEGSSASGTTSSTDSLTKQPVDTAKDPKNQVNFKKN